MAIHSSILAREIPGTEEPGGLQSMGSKKSQTWLRSKKQQRGSKPVFYGAGIRCTPARHNSFAFPWVKIIWIIIISLLLISSVQFSRSVVSDSLRPHESQHARPPCPSPTPGVHPDSRPSSQWCHPAISSSVVPFSSCPQSLPASGSFPMSQGAWGAQSTGVSASASVLPMNTQDWSPLGCTGWIRRRNCKDAVQGALKSLLQHQVSKASILQHSAFFLAFKQAMWYC